METKNTHIHSSALHRRRTNGNIMERISASCSAPVNPYLRKIFDLRYEQAAHITLYGNDKKSTIAALHIFLILSMLHSCTCITACTAPTSCIDENVRLMSVRILSSSHAHVGNVYPIARTLSIIFTNTVGM